MMTQAFYTGLSGIRANNTAIDVISDNLSNVSTIGFRSYDTEFSSMFETMLNTTAAKSSVNSSVGVGTQMRMSSMDTSQGVFQLTPRSKDLAILGDGWFGLQGEGNTVYTRDGSFDFDVNRDLVAPDGYYVLGTMGDNIQDGVLTQQLAEIPLSAPKTQTKLSFPDELYFPPVATTEASFYGNLTSDSTFDPLNLAVEAPAIDLDATVAAGDIIATPTATDEDGGTITYSIDNTNLYAIDPTTGVVTLTAAGETAINSSNKKIIPEFTITATSTSGSESSKVIPEDTSSSVMAVSSTLINDQGTRNALRLEFVKSVPQIQPGVQWDVTATVKNLDGTETYATETGNLSFDEQGSLITSTLTSIDNQGTAVTINFGDADVGIVSRSNGQTLSSQANGWDDGTLLGYDINKNGEVLATFTNGQQSNVGTIAVYHFANDRGLERANGSRFFESSNSGDPIFFTDADGKYITGTDLANNKLEGSNVKLEAGLTNLIIMQRAYDSNSKVISTVDQMLQKALSMDA